MFDNISSALWLAIWIEGSGIVYSICRRIWDEGLDGWIDVVANDDTIFGS
jgi:hypothetical protein